MKNKVTDKITSINTVKLKDEIPSKEIYISLEKQIIDDLKFI